MKIAILTLHALKNPGSLLQAYALQHFLQEQGEKVQIIDYRPRYVYNEGSSLKYFVKKLLFFPFYLRQKKKYEDFIKKYLSLSKRYNSYEELKEMPVHADVYMLGSDQLWNCDHPCGKDPVFYLSFTEGVKIAYATSIGKPIVDDINIEIIRKYSSQFKHIGLREKSNATQISRALDRKVEWVCDPVLLLDANNYNSMIDSSKNISMNNYVMVYLSPKSKLLDEIVAYYKKKGCKIILVGGFTKRCECDAHIKDAGPVDFLYYIKHAQCVVSTSFHATTFCHILHIPFVAIVPKTNGERINSLLELSGLTNRGIYSNEINMADVEKPIDWESVDLKIGAYIRQSQDLLNSWLKE